MLTSEKENKTETLVVTKTTADLADHFARAGMRALADGIVTPAQLFMAMGLSAKIVSGMVSMKDGEDVDFDRGQSAAMDGLKSGMSIEVQGKRIDAPRAAFAGAGSGSVH